MIGVLLALVDPIGAIVRQIVAARATAQNAKTEQERIAADERVKALEARRDVLISASSSPWQHVMRAAFALPFVVYNLKVVVWDKVLSMGATDPLSADLANVQMIVIGGYFLFEASRAWGRK